MNVFIYHSTEEVSRPFSSQSPSSIFCEGNFIPSITVIAYVGFSTPPTTFRCQRVADSNKR